MVSLYFGLLSADGTADAVRLLGESVRDSRIARLLALGKTPSWLRAIARPILVAFGQHRTAELVGSIGRRFNRRVLAALGGAGGVCRAFLREMAAARLDALLCPPHALPALRHGSTRHLAVAASYCFFANVLGVPAGVVPVTRVRAGEESDRSDSRDVVDREAREVERDSAGLPVGVQVSGRPWREDVVLAVMGALSLNCGPGPIFRTHLSHSRDQPLACWHTQTLDWPGVVASRDRSRNFASGKNRRRSIADFPQPVYNQGVLRMSLNYIRETGHP